MKKIFLFVFLGILLNCDKDNTVQNNNPYLPNYSFTYTINTTLPQYSNLEFPSNGIYINTAGIGIRGVFVFNAGSGNYTAFDAACPNQPLTDCSTMTINGIEANCSCDNANYSLFTGLASGKQYPMKQYRVEVVNASTLRVYN